MRKVALQGIDEIAKLGTFYGSHLSRPTLLRSDAENDISCAVTSVKKRDLKPFPKKWRSAPEIMAADQFEWQKLKSAFHVPAGRGDTSALREVLDEVKKRIAQGQISAKELEPFESQSHESRRRYDEEVAAWNRKHSMSGYQLHYAKAGLAVLRSTDALAGMKAKAEAVSGQTAALAIAKSRRKSKLSSNTKLARRGSITSQNVSMNAQQLTRKLSAEDVPAHVESWDVTSEDWEESAETSFPPNEDSSSDEVDGDRNKHNGSAILTSGSSGQDSELGIGVQTMEGKTRASRPHPSAVQAELAPRRRNRRSSIKRAKVCHNRSGATNHGAGNRRSRKREPAAMTAAGVAASASYIAPEHESIKITDDKAKGSRAMPHAKEQQVKVRDVILRAPAKVPRGKSRDTSMEVNVKKVRMRKSTLQMLQLGYEDGNTRAAKGTSCPSGSDPLEDTLNRQAPMLTGFRRGLMSAREPPQDLHVGLQSENDGYSGEYSVPDSDVEECPASTRTSKQGPVKRRKESSVPPRKSQKV